MSYGSSDSSTKPFTKWSTPFFSKEVLPFTQQLLQGYDPSGGALRKSAGAEYERELSGANLDPANNPTLAPTTGAITRNAKEYLDQALQGVGNRAQGAGMLLSNKTAQIMGDTARKSAADVADRITNLYGQNYGQERGIQAGAASQATAASQLDLNQLLQFMQMLKGGTSKTSQGDYSLL